MSAALKKVKRRCKTSEIRAPMDGILSSLDVIDGELVATEMPSHSFVAQNYVRGEVNEEDVGEVKVGMKAVLQLYAYRTRQFRAKVTSIVPDRRS